MHTDIWYIHTYTHIHVLLVHMAILVCIKTLLSNSSGSYVLLLFDIYCVCECICVCMWFVKIVACALMTQGDTGWPKSTEMAVSMIYVGSRYHIHLYICTYVCIGIDMYKLHAIRARCSFGLCVPYNHGN